MLYSLRLISTMDQLNKHTNIITQILTFILPDDANALYQTSKGSKLMFQNVTQYCKLNELKEPQLPPFLLPPSMYVNGRRFEYPKNTTYSPPTILFVNKARTIYDSKTRTEYKFTKEGFISTHKNSPYRDCGPPSIYHNERKWN